jgi:hypothetical protein
VDASSTYSSSSGRPVRAARIRRASSASVSALLWTGTTTVTPGTKVNDPS